MKKNTILTTIMIAFFYTQAIKAECLECKRFREELRKSDDHSMKMMKELRALTKDLNTVCAQVRKLQL